jgi:diaminopimelate decarboxylase
MVAVQNPERLLSGADFLGQHKSLPSVPSPNQQLLPLSASVTGDHLVIGGCSVPDLVEQFGSPLYILDESTLRTAAQQYRQSLTAYYPGVSQVIYASKAWSCTAVCAIVNSEGIGLDVVSGGELYTGLQAGVAPQDIYLHGNNKSLDELQYAVETGITIIADNWLELENLITLAQSHQGQPIRVMLRITPGIECHTHEYIRTGHLDSKFGFDPNQLAEVFQFALQHPELQWVGLHAHIGSQIFELQPHQDLTGVVVDLLAQAQSLGLPMTELNVGGGLGICYTESVQGHRGGRDQGLRPADDSAAQTVVRTGAIADWHCLRDGLSHRQQKNCARNPHLYFHRWGDVRQSQTHYLSVPVSGHCRQSNAGQSYRNRHRCRKTL